MLLMSLQYCQLCQREKPLTFHHLIPRKNHRKNWFLKQFSKQEMKHRGIYVCPDCHYKIHQVYDEKTLGKYYNTLEALQNDPEIRKFINWVRKKK